MKLALRKKESRLAAAVEQILLHLKKTHNQACITKKGSCSADTGKFCC